MKMVQCNAMLITMYFLKSKFKFIEHTKNSNHEWCAGEKQLSVHTAFHTETDLGILIHEG